MKANRPDLDHPMPDPHALREAALNAFAVRTEFGGDTLKPHELYFARRRKPAELTVQIDGSVVVTPGEFA
jgi:hypothetical protein